MRDKPSDASLIHELEALYVGPGEVLIVRVPGRWGPEAVAALVDAFAEVGLNGRALVLQEDDAGFAKVVV